MNEFTFSEGCWGWAAAWLSHLPWQALEKAFLMFFVCLHAARKSWKPEMTSGYVVLCAFPKLSFRSELAKQKGTFNGFIVATLDCQCQKPVDGAPKARCELTENLLNKWNFVSLASLSLEYPKIDIFSLISHVKWWMARNHSIWLGLILFLRLETRFDIECHTPPA